MTKMSVQEADKLIAEKLSEAHDLINECEKLADQHNTTFDFSVNYGMGGTYYGKKRPKSSIKQAALAKLTVEEREALGLVNEDEDDGDSDEWDSSGGWESSSQNC